MKTYLQIIYFGILLVLGYPSLQACSPGTALAWAESWRLLREEEEEEEHETLVNLLQASATSNTKEEQSCIKALIKALCNKLSRKTTHHDHEE